MHSQRRRVWDRAFTPASLKDYEPMIHRRASQLIEQLSKRKGQEIDLGHWMGCFTLDFMGDLAFGSAFNNLEEGGEQSGLQRMIESGVRVQDLFGTVPWIRALWVVMPRPPAVRKIYALGEQVLAKRKVKGAMRKDIFFHLLDEDGSSGHEPLSDASLVMDASIALVAGSDTTAVALSNVFYYLLVHSQVLTRLRDELESHLPPGDENLDMTLLGQLPFLNAVINEALRLQPATPTGLQRCPPADSNGVTVGQIVIPPGTTVQIPTWSLHRDPRYFWPHPNSFYPDRWLVDPKTANSDNFRLNTMAYMPFSYGPQNCVGKQLALNELRYVISSLLRTFDFEVAPGWDLRQWEENLRAFYILEHGPLPVIVTPRK
jgi:cytochrome P450